MDIVAEENIYWFSISTDSLKVHGMEAPLRCKGKLGAHTHLDTSYLCYARAK